MLTDKKNLHKGKFIVFEGGEASGKTTQINLLKEKYKNNPKISFSREPGGTDISNKIREIITTGSIDKLLPETELALIYAARNEHLHKFILPAINKGINIICDRCYLSTLTYQSQRGISLNLISSLNNLFMQNFKPDLTLLFDLDVEIARNRVINRNNENERFESLKNDFHQKIRDTYLYHAQHNNIHIIDAAQNQNDIHQQVSKKIENMLNI